ncbi:MAG TPA: DUF4390 domain-containing protein [Steroidobacteraceae bacterium]|nr:DUF4390 domain-containing protein [Steroidobacteraceae bacterium]
MNAPRSNFLPKGSRTARPPASLLWLAGAVLAVSLWTRPLQADGLEGRFEVRSADLDLKDGVYHLNARIDLPVSDAVRRGLTEGVPLTVELDLDIERVRQLLPNSRVAELTQRYHLQYNAVSARYVLRNVNSGQQESLGTVDAAIELLSEVRGLPVLDKALIAPDRRYEASVRAKIDYGSVPFTLRVLMFWVSDWHRESDWYTWTLQP